MKNNFQYKWSKIFASKRYCSKDGVVTITPDEQQDILDDSGSKSGMISFPESYQKSCGDLRVDHIDADIFVFFIHKK